MLARTYAPRIRCLAVLETVVDPPRNVILTHTRYRAYFFCIFVCEHCLYVYLHVSPTTLLGSVCCFIFVCGCLFFWWKFGRLEAHPLRASVLFLSS